MLIIHISPVDNTLADRMIWHLNECVINQMIIIIIILFFMHTRCTVPYYSCILYSTLVRVVYVYAILFC